MKLVQKLMIGAALFALAPSAFAVDSMYGDSVVTVRERKQIVKINGPTSDVKAVFLKPTEASAAKISIVSKVGGSLIELESNDQLGLVVEGEKPPYNLSSIIDDEVGNLIITLESEDKSGESHLTIGYDPIDKRFELLNLTHFNIDWVTPNQELERSCSLNVADGTGLNMGKVINFNKKEIAFQDLNKSQDFFNCSAWIK